ncbi:lipoprotein [Streptomyces inusitatus]|uniref:Lipoprotein n=1 Tax=Streptomyces inusitatus TaxID=68221 RepID=A0A918QDC2_9ACTN|nr:lipoprotein [Streptomyces inusitatus]
MLVASLPSVSPVSSDSRGSRTRRAVLALALCAGLVLSATACAAEEKPDPDKGTNGIGKLTAEEIENKARAAAEAATAVRLSGTLVSKGGTFKLNMRLKEDGGTGSVTSKENTFELLRVADDLYLKADAGFWTHEDGAGSGDAGGGTGGAGGEGGKDGKAAPGGTGAPLSEADAEAAGKLGDKYVKVPQGDPAYKEFRGFTEMDVLLDGLLGMQGELSKGERTKVGGIQTIKVQAADGVGGVLDVSLEGEPYPLQFARAGGKGVLTLGEWDAEFELAAPAKGETVDYGGQLPKSSD